MLNVPAGMSGLTTLEFRSYKGRVCEETIHLCHKPDPAPIKEGDAVTVTPEGEIHKLVTAGAGRDGMTKLRIKEIARIIGAHPDALEACDRVTVVSGGVVKTMPSEEFIRDFDKFFDIQFARPAKGDTTPAETTVNCGGPLVSASVVKEKDALIARLKAMIKEKDGRLRDQGEKIKGLHRDLKIVKKYINISPSSVVTTIGEVITTHNKLMKLQTEVERLEHAGRNNLASIDAAMRREACAVAEADQAKKELEAQKNYVAHLKNQISVLEGVVNRLSKESK